MSKARPGGRTAEVSRRLFATTMDLLVEGGFGAVTFQAVAERAEVARATLYRRWTNPSALIADAIRSTASQRIVIPDTGSIRDDLEEILEQIAGFLSEPIGTASLIAGLTLNRNDTDDDSNNHWIIRWNEVRPVFDRAVQRGELTEDCDPEAIFASLAGALYFRLLVIGQLPDKDWIGRVMANAMSGICAPNSHRS